jgi:2-polyprenyl-6-methoxyphenol hydroxylase-like FAD-dependent oxidoreductase
MQNVVARDVEAEVAIIGGGPVGLTLAIDLAQRGVSVAVAERRAAGEPPSVKCNHVSSRTMETFRRLGFVEAARNAGLPDDYPNDVTVRTRATGFEMMRIHIPCRTDRYTDVSGPDGWWPTAEPAHRINQIFLEPVLFAAAAATPGVRIFNRTEIEGIAEEGGGVAARARDLETGRRFTIRAAWAVACDGGKSSARRWIGATLKGDALIQRVQSSYIRAPGLLPLIRGKTQWMSYLYAPERAGNLVAIDGRETWLLHNYLLDDESFDTVDRDACIRTLLGVGPDFRYEILGREDWIGRRLVVDKVRSGRVFICGDAAHIWVPYAGYGMNAGIADAMNLSWMLAAHLRGWAPEALLDAHQKERLPITEQVSRFAMRHAEGAIKERTSVPPEIEDEGPPGEAARRRVGEAAYALHVQQFACAGLNYGYYYEGSPIIAYDGEAAPGYTMADYTPSTVPGCRTPWFKLPDGRGLYDAAGAWFTLIRLDPSIDVGPLVRAAETRGLPLAVVDAPRASAPEVYRHALLLSRPDQHVAWRGDAVPSDPLALVDRVRGAA